MTRFVTLICAVIAFLIGAPTASADEGAGALLAAAVRGEVQISSDVYVMEAEASVDQFADINHLPRVAFVNLSGSDLVKTGCGSASGYDAYYYCHSNHVAYIGTAHGEYFNQGTDYLAGALLIAHEWGHHLQYMRVPYQYGTKAHENGADCVGGAWLKWFNDTRHANLNFGDALGFASLAVKIESPADSGDSHGTAFERGWAMFTGYTRGLAGCNSDYAPIFP